MGWLGFMNQFFINNLIADSIYILIATGIAVVYRTIKVFLVSRKVYKMEKIGWIY